MSKIEAMENPDLLEVIFRFLDPASVKAASLVSRLIVYIRSETV